MKSMNKHSQSLEQKKRSSNPLTYKPAQAYLNNFAPKNDENEEMNEFINVPIHPVNNIKNIK